MEAPPWNAFALQRRAIPLFAYLFGRTLRMMAEFAAGLSSRVRLQSGGLDACHRADLVIV